MKIKFKVIKLNYKVILSLFTLISVLSSLLIYNVVNASKQEGIKLPIIMYHSVLNSQKGKFIVSSTQFENDLKYIKEKGFTTITMTDLINYVYDDVKLPEKPIMITFDDGYYNNLVYVAPLLKKYDMKAVVSIVGKFTDIFTETNEKNSNYGHLRWEDIKELMENGTIEFQNHSYDLHSNSNGRNGSMKKKNESLKEYTEFLKKDILKLQDEFKKNTNYIPNTFTYPFAAISKGTTNMLKEMGFKASLGSSSRINYITKDADCLYLLKRFNRDGNVSTEKFFKKVLDKSLIL